MFLSCSAQSALNYTELDLKWKKDAMFMLSERYMRYKEKHDLERKINSEIDLFIKFNDINRYPIRQGIEKLKNEIESKKIVFDSIIFLIEQSSRQSDLDYLYPASYYIFKDDKIIKYFFIDAYDFKLSESEWTMEDKEHYEYVINKSDGDDMALLIFTVINPNWEFEINKIVINSY
jgi:uncharacterized lipoprotein YehR (DUF1307 family)